MAPPQMVFYVVQGERGEDMGHPNVYTLSPSRGATLGDVKAQCPLRNADGSNAANDFHWRFRANFPGKSGYVWQDVRNDSDEVPVAGSNVFAKLLRLDTLKTIGRAGPIASRAGVSRRDAELVTPRTATKGSKHNAQANGSRFQQPSQPGANAVSKKSAPPGLSAEQQVKLRREKEAKAREEKVRQLRERETEVAKSNEDFRRVSKELNEKMLAWSGPEGNLKNIRALLSTLHNVLWEGANWTPVTVLVRPQEVKKAYRKACLVVHTDKISSDAGPEIKFIAQRIFDSLKTQYAKFEQNEL